MHIQLHTSDHPLTSATQSLNSSQLRHLLIDAGADDAACVSLNRDDLAEEAVFAERAMPGTRTLISYCVRMNRESIRTTERSIANHEFHQVGDEIGEIGRSVARQLEDLGVRALSPPWASPWRWTTSPGASG